MDLAAIRERIMSTPLVGRLPDGMRQRFVMILLWLSDTREVTREETLFKQGDAAGDEGCLILEGMVRIKTESAGNKTIEAPDILGEVQLFTPNKQRTATVEVVVGGNVLTFSWHELANAAKEHFSDAEFADLKRVITESAWTREDNLQQKVKVM
jgi:CRP-like cAMP-binding protein